MCENTREVEFAKSPVITHLRNDVKQKKNNPISAEKDTKNILIGSDVNSLPGFAFATITN